MPDISEFCPHCGRPVREGNVFEPDSVRPASSASAESSQTQNVSPTEPRAQTPLPETPPAPQRPVDWDERIPGALAYLTFIPALVFLFIEPYQKRKFVRFHAFQSLMFWAGVLAFTLLGLLASMFGWLFLWLLSGTLTSLALFFTWLLLSIKALQGEWFELPFLGPFAEQHSGR
jgi:uncharacterized membrane protein